jgi:hypothetical protein
MRHVATMKQHWLKRGFKQSISCAALCAVVSILAGCGGSTPTGLDWDSSSAAAAAITACDKNGDRQIDLGEAAACPGLRGAMDRVDTDVDGKMSSNEIANRIDYYASALTTIFNGGVEIKLNGEPLVGAEVVFEHEPFLGAGEHVYRGTTDDHGRVDLQGGDSEFPGIHIGMYRVRISKMQDGKETLPPKYNQETTLGCEVADDIPEQQNVISFALTTSK